jgi:hypothetical protein
MSTTFNFPSAVPLESCRTCCTAEIFNPVPLRSRRLKQQDSYDQVVRNFPLVGRQT